MSFQFLDELIREYLTFRGFVSTLKAFDGDVKSEKEKAFRSDKVVDQIQNFVSTFDLQGLRDLWQHLNSRLFRRLDPAQTGAINRLESGVLKLYLVNCIQNKNSEKVKEFFEKMSSELHGQSEWKEWFALPFLSNPENNPTFVNYFSRHWQDTLMLSLNNFLAIIFASLPPPKLAQYNSSTVKIKRLREENEVMRNTLLKQQQQSKIQKLPPLDIPRPTDVMDDFYIIASHHESNTNAANHLVSQTNTENHARGLKGFLRNITGTSSTAVASPSGTTSTSSRERASSRSRTPSSNNSSNISSKQHAPVKRVSVTSNLSQSLITNNELENQVQDSAGGSRKLSGINPGGGERLAYLLLGQEEYQEHHSEVTQCKFSSSGYSIASSDVDGVVKVWSASPVLETSATFVSQSGVSSLDWLPNSDRKLIYGTMNGIVRICDIDERKFAHEFNCTTNVEGRTTNNEPIHYVKQISCSNNGICAIASSELGNGNGRLMLYDLKSAKTIENDLTTCINNASSADNLNSTGNSVTTCVFNHNAQMIITGNTDGKVRIFDLRKRDCISSWSLTDQTVPILTLQMSTDETCIYALSSGGQFSAWSFIQTSQKIFDTNLEDPYFNSELYPRAAWGKQFSFAGDGKHILTCSTAGGVIYEVVEESSSNGEKKLEKVLGLKGHRRHATCTDWSNSTDCGPCVTAGFDGQIRISTLLSQ